MEAMATLRVMKPNQLMRALGLRGVSVRNVEMPKKASAPIGRLM